VQTLLRHRLEFALPSAEERADMARSSKADDEISPWVNPADMSETDRAALVARIQAGEVFSLRFRAVVFGDAGNQNRTELEAKHVRQLAKSAGRGHQNLLNGHGDIFGGSPASPVVGEVLGGKATKREDASGETVLVLDHRLADVGAMIQFARGLWRTFSISIGSPDGWDYALLDADGNETDDYWEADSYVVRPRGEVFLVHNAFVADPAYLGTAVIQPHGARSAEELRRFMAADKDKTGSEGKDKGAQDHAAAEVVRLSAALSVAERDLASARAELAAAQADLKAERDSHFRAVFDGAVREGKATPAEEALYSTFAQAQGVSKAAEMLAARRSVVPMQPVGLSAAQTPAAPVGGERPQATDTKAAEFSDEAASELVSIGFNKKKGAK
jgi:hypothetical protein